MVRYGGGDEQAFRTSESHATRPLMQGLSALTTIHRWIGNQLQVNWEAGGLQSRSAKF
jgi:hypothetical protein